MSTSVSGGAGGVLADDDDGEPDAVSGGGGGFDRRLLTILAAVFLIVLSLGLALQRASSSSDDGGGPAAERVVDDFDREEGALGTAPTGQSWDIVSGALELEEGAAVAITEPRKGVRTLAVIDAGSTNATVRGTVASMASGWGLVFRYANPFDYWYVSAVPEFATYNIVRVADGQDDVVGSTNLSEVAEGTQVEVVLDGPVIEVTIDGTPAFSTADDHAYGATRAGLISLVSGGRVAWGAFEASPAADEGAPNTPILRDPASTTSLPSDGEDRDEPEEEASEPPERIAPTTTAEVG